MCENYQCGLAVICPMKEEAAYILAIADEVEGKELLLDKVVYRCVVGGKKLVLAISDIGRVNAAITATALCMEYKPAAMLLFGFAGGIGAGLKQGDIVVVNKMRNWDIDNAVFGCPKGAIPFEPVYEFHSDKALAGMITDALDARNLPYYSGGSLVGDSFVSLDRSARLTDEFGAEYLTAEMESTGAARATLSAGIPLVHIRVISDAADSEALEAFTEYIAAVKQPTARLLKEVIRAI